MAAIDLSAGKFTNLDQSKEAQRLSSTFREIQKLQRKPDAVLVMDNLRPHKTPEVQAVLDGSGFPYRYLPSYSPDLSPIEPGWAKVKSYLRRVAARTVEALQQALAPALDSITAQDAAAFFRHCGHACPN